MKSRNYEKPTGVVIDGDIKILPSGDITLADYDPVAILDRMAMAEFPQGDFKLDFKNTKIICDNSNNSPRDLDEGRMNVDMYVPIIRPVYDFKIVIDKDGVHPIQVDPI